MLVDKSFAATFPPVGTKIVVFDLGNVLIQWDRRLLFDQLIDDPAELQHFLDNILTMEDNKRLDSGVALAEVAADAAARHPEYHDLIMAFGSRWKETLGEVIEGSVRILEDLKAAGTPLYALTNWGKDTFASIEADYPFFSHFDGMVVSGREGVIKPSSAIYRILCDRYGFSPSDAVFIDDSGANIATAAALGFDALLFENPQRLRQQLIYRSLLT